MLGFSGCKRIAVRNLSNVKKEHVYPTDDSTAIGTGVSKTRDRGLSSFKNAVLGLGLGLGLGLRLGLGLGLTLSLFPNPNPNPKTAFFKKKIGPDPGPDLGGR